MAVTEKEREQIRQELLEEQKLARRAYRREWHKKNPGKAKEYNKRHWRKVLLAELEQEKQKGDQNEN